MVTAVLFVQTLWRQAPSLLSLAFAPRGHYLCRRCCSSCTLRTPRAFTRPVCSWRALFVPPLMQLVHSSYASSLYSTRVFLVRTTRNAYNAARAVYECFEPSLDLGSLAGTNYPAGTTARAVSKRLEPLLDPGSLVGSNCPADATACGVSERLGPLLYPGSLAGTNYPADAPACAVHERLGPLLDPGSLAGTNCPADATACLAMIRPTMFQVQQSSCES